jgi:hypothetical protein
MELKEAQRLVLPADEPAPAKMLAMPILLAAASLAELPARWNLADPAGLGSALQLLMPGEWDSRHLSVVASKIRDAYAAAADADGEGLQCVPTLREEVQWLLSRVDLADCGHVLEPFNGTGTVSAVLREFGIQKVTTNDLAGVVSANMHLDALQPTFYQKCAEAQGAIDAVVCSPWFTVLDVALPLAVSAARSVVCMHVPGHYVASGLAPRYTYLRELQQQGRLAVLFGLPRGPMGWRCAWIVVFKSAALKAKLMKPGWRDADGLVCSAWGA